MVNAYDRITLLYIEGAIHAIHAGNVFIPPLSAQLFLRYMEDITAVLAFEVKKEMADRYFGFRKRIEEDTSAYTERLDQSAIDLENKIGFSLLRLYTLLHDEPLIQAFIQLIGLPKDFFYDRYIMESHTIHKRIFADQKYRGLTPKRGIVNMFYDNYIRLVTYIDDYRSTIEELTEEQETIREQINLFYRNNDIDSILSFLRRLDSPNPNSLSAMQPAGNCGPNQRLSSKMRLHPPLPACEMLPDIPAIPPFKRVKKRLRSLLKQAMENHPEFDLEELTRKP